MCLAKACIKENGQEELAMDGIAPMKIENDRFILNSIFGEQKKMEARIKEIDFVHHSTTLVRTRTVEVRK